MAQSPISLADLARKWGMDAGAIPAPSLYHTATPPRNAPMPTIRDLARSAPAASVSTYKPATYTQALLDKLAQADAWANQRIGGMDPRAAAQMGSQTANTVGSFIPAQSIEKVLTPGTQAAPSDYINTALAALPLTGRVAGRALAPAAEALANTQLGKYLTESRAMPAVDDALEGQFRVVPTAQTTGPDLAAQPQLTGPAPKPQLAGPTPTTALPAPTKSDLPSFAVKPRGGQWIPPGTAPFVNTDEVYGELHAPEDLAAKLSAMFKGFDTPHDDATARWIDSNLVKYIKNDFGAPTDPLYALDQQGVKLPSNYYLDFVPWSDKAGYSVVSAPFGEVTSPGTAGEATLRDRPEDMPWLGETHPWAVKQPVTAQIHGLSGDAFHALGFDNLADELNFAVSPREETNLPANLALDPKSLQRLSVADAVKRVSDINAWRAEQTSADRLPGGANPSIVSHKVYENDPRGMQWVELKAPEGGAASAGLSDTGAAALQEALQYEGDTMGHCVGDYCPDVLSGQSRIFSLRDAKGSPHVTIETTPSDTLGVSSIAQIKGNQNTAPKTDYLPYVQDFVKSQPWGNVNDLQNANMVKLPDNRYITSQQAEQGVNAVPDSPDMPTGIDPARLHQMDPNDWQQIAPHFAGFAFGGRIDASRML